MARPSGSVRCAVYTRKSTDEGLHSDFNTLDAQREAAEAYIASQKSEGWVCLPDRYDDGGYTGGNMERPALKRLLAHARAGRVDCVVVYKVDRLSRSLLDFARIMGVLEAHAASFVSVTQQFNTTTSMGRLTLNILLSFAQFEREIISERTRDKIASARRKGKWSGGRPILGYDVDPKGGRLMINEEEAQQVRTIFELYLDRRSLIETIKELDARGWANKRWVTKRGHEAGGRPFTKPNLLHLLKNVLYVGKVTYKRELHDGEQPAIVDAHVFERVQRILKRNGTTGGKHVRNRFGALLKGLIYCAPCRTAMIHTHTKKRDKRYRYYVCLNAQKRGWHTCPSKSLPAQEIEDFVVDQVRCIGKDERLLAETLDHVRREGEKRVRELEVEKRLLARDLKRQNAQLKQVAGRGPGNDLAADRSADLHDRIRAGEERLTEVREELESLAHNQVNDQDVAQALARFDPVWGTLAPREQIRIIRLLVQRVDYDGRKGTVSVTFHPTGIKALAHELDEATA